MRRKEYLSARDLIRKCMAMGALTLAPGVSIADALASADVAQNDAMPPTPWNELGPFDKRNPPNIDELRAPGDEGLPLSVSGRIFDARGEALEGATLS
jgi:protocatechuate 3,4-dioxygenase beta subunit